MSTVKKRELNDLNTAYALLKKLRSSPSKVGDVAALIRGLGVNDALIQLNFCKRRIAHDVAKCLKSAIANAEHNHNLDVDRLVVKEIMVGKSFVMKRFRARARGRAGKILKPFSNIKITLAEIEEVS